MRSKMQSCRCAALEGCVWGIEVQIRSFLTSALDGFKLPVSSAKGKEPSVLTG
jgi:hypothetical protein